MLIGVDGEIIFQVLLSDGVPGDKLRDFTKGRADGIGAFFGNKALLFFEFLTFFFVFSW